MYNIDPQLRRKEAMQKLLRERLSQSKGNRICHGCRLELTTHSTANTEPLPTSHGCSEPGCTKIGLRVGLDGSRSVSGDPRSCPGPRWAKPVGPGGPNAIRKLGANTLGPGGPNTWVPAGQSGTLGSRWGERVAERGPGPSKLQLQSSRFHGPGGSTSCCSSRRSSLFIELSGVASAELDSSLSPASNMEWR